MMKSIFEPITCTAEAPTETGAPSRGLDAGQLNGEMSYRIVHKFPSDALEYRWRELLAQVDLPSHYTSPEYFREPYFDGKRPFAILALAGETIVAVLTGVHEGNTVTCGLPTRPQVQLHPRCNPAAALDALSRGLDEESRGAKLISVYSWEWLPLTPLLRRRYRNRTLIGNPVLDLRAGADALLKACDGKRRNCIRYAIKHGVEVASAQSPEDYKAFYEIYANWCTAKKTECYSFAVEDLAFQTTGLNRRLFLARHSGKVIAGSVFRFCPGGLIEYSRNSSLPEFQSLKPNDLLVWKAIEWGCENGFTHLSMGGSHRFLREFGGPIIPIIRYRWDRTFLRRFDRREEFAEVGRKYVGKLPPKWEKRVRQVIGKEVPAGW